MKFTATLALGAFTALSLVALPACDDKKDDKKADAKKDDKKADAKCDEKADAKGDEKGEEKAAEAGAEGGGGADKVGVEVCDEYLEKYEACIDEFAPEATKTQLKEALTKTRESWAEMAAGAGKETLDQTCKASLEAVKKTSSGWGCKY